MSPRARFCSFRIASAALLLAQAALAAVEPKGPSALLVPFGGATPAPELQTYTGPYRATLACGEGVKNFPFLKSWVAKLENFVAPYEIGSNDGSLFYAIGVTTAGKGVPSAWKTDAYRAMIDFKKKGGSIESNWLGGLPAPAPPVIPGPGYSVVHKGGGRAGSTSSQSGSRRSTTTGSTEPALQGYTAASIFEGTKTGPWARLWSLLFSGAELELLEACTTADCKIKFTESEQAAVAGASHQYRVAKFRQTIDKRIEEYQKLGHVWAYEGSHAPVDWQDLPLSPLFPRELETHFWIPSDRASFSYDVLDAEPGHHKPVVGLFSRQCERKGEGAKAFTACTDVAIYNNHYFDFWARIVFFFPWCDTQVVLAYEAMDIDQVKESRVARVLFGGEMRKLMGELLETRLKRIHMLGY